MELVILPFFAPLLLVGWVVDAWRERSAAKAAAVTEAQWRRAFVLAARSSPSTPQRVQDDRGRGDDAE